MCKTQYHDGNLLARLVPGLGPTQEEIDILTDALKECLATSTGERGSSRLTEASRLDYIRMVTQKALKDTYNQ